MDLAVQKRTMMGRGVKRLRQEGFIPAELYGHGVENVHLAVPTREFHKAFQEAGETTLVNLRLDRQTVPVLIYNIARNPVTDKVESVDFYQVRLDEKLTAKVPVEFVGQSPAVKEKNGVLIKAMKEIEVEALPADMPHNLMVDISRLADVNQSLYVRDLPPLVKVKILVAPDSVIATVKARMTEEEEKVLAEAAAPSVESVVVETEEKKALRQIQGDGELAVSETGDLSSPELRQASKKPAAKAMAGKQEKR